MAILNKEDLTFNGEEIRQMNEAVVEAVYAKFSLTEIHTIIGGVKTKKQIAIIARGSQLTGKGSGGCNKAADDLALSMSEKFWITATVSNNVKICYTELEDTFVAWGLQNGLKKSDLTKTEFWDFLVDYFADLLEEEIWRITWFSDTAAATTADSPAGVITAGTDLTYFNKIDGFWKQLFAIVTANSTRKVADLASRNGQATFALQEFTATDTSNFVVTNALQNVRYKADTRLRAEQGVRYLVTQSVADQYERELTHANKAYTTERLEGGITILRSGGIEVVAIEIWDRIIRAYFSDGTKYYLPHRILLVNKTNLQIATEEEGTFTEVKSIYDEVEEYNYLRTQYEIDAKVILDDFVQLAY